MTDYGVKATTTLWIALEKGYFPSKYDVYNPNLPNFGNSRYGRSSSYDSLGWDFSDDNETDIRLFYVFRNRDSWSPCKWNPSDDSIPKFWRISNITDRQICYTSETLKYT